MLLCDEVEVGVEVSLIVIVFGVGDVGMCVDGVIIVMGDDVFVDYGGVLLMWYD